MNTLLSPFQEFWKKGDKLLLLLCLLASVYGVALIFSATRYNGNNRAVITQCVAILLGAVIYILCTFIDFQLFVEKNGAAGNMLIWIDEPRQVILSLQGFLSPQDMLHIAQSVKLSDSTN